MTQVSYKSQRQNTYSNKYVKSLGLFIYRDIGKMGNTEKANYVQGGVREMLAIAVPMVISNACDTVMVFTDRLFLSRLNPELMNASMGGGLTVFMMMSFFLGLTGYTTALSAQYLGARRKRLCAVVLTQAVIISLMAYPLILLCRPLGVILFEKMGVNQAQLGPQKVFFNILMLGVIISLLRNCLSSFFSGIGRTGVVMVATCAAMIINVVLNYVLIFGKFGFPSLGIRGAAYATITAGVCGLMILSVAYFRKNIRAEFHIKESLRFDTIVFKKLLHFGSSVGLEMFLNILAFNGIVLLFHSYGPATATAATIVFNWDMVSFVPLIGIEIGITSLVGRCMGAQRPEIAHQTVMSGLKVGLLYSTVILVLFLGFPGLLVGIFHPQVPDAIFAAAVPTAVFMVRFASFYVLVEAMLIVFIGALRGAGDTFWAMRMSVAIHWVMVFVVWFMLRKLGASAEATWTLMVLQFLLFSGFVFMRYKEGKWKHIRVVYPEPVMAPEPVFHETRDL